MRNHCRRLDTIQFWHCVARRMTTNAVYVDQTFEATKILEIIGALSLIF